MRCFVADDRHSFLIWRTQRACACVACLAIALRLVFLQRNDSLTVRFIACFVIFCLSSIIFLSHHFTCTLNIWSNRLLQWSLRQSIRNSIAFSHGVIDSRWQQFYSIWRFNAYWVSGQRTTNGTFLASFSECAIVNACGPSDNTQDTIELSLPHNFSI